MSRVRVRLNEARLRKIAGIQFRPGLQSVDSDGWARVKAHPVGAILLGRDILVEVKSSKPGRPSAEDVVAEIKDTYDMDELKGYLDDSRKTVSDAAQSQIDKINAAGA